MNEGPEADALNETSTLTWSRTVSMAERLIE